MTLSFSPITQKFPSWKKEEKVEKDKVLSWLIFAGGVEDLLVWSESTPAVESLGMGIKMQIPGISFRISVSVRT